MDLTSYFSPDYRSARARFRRLARERGAAQDVLTVGLGDLTADVAAFGEPGASRVVLATSGLHGVEGFFGSAVQLAWLDALPPAWRPPAGTAVVVIHALNPFGFDVVRRANEENVDLNRNFLAPGEAYADCPDLYRRLDTVLNPQGPHRLDIFAPRLLPVRLRHGGTAVRHAIAAGQYEFPQGLFFGGRGPSATVKALSEYLPAWLDPSERILHLDYHTGLGTYASYCLLTAQPSASESVVRLRALYGRAVEPRDVGTTAYFTRGSIDEWVTRRWAGREVDSVCAEFGTYNPLAVLAAIRAENRAHHWPGDRATTAKSKRRLMEAFVPADKVWRLAVVRQGVDLIQRALAY